MAANRVQSVFCRGVYLAENTSQTASVEFVPHRGPNYARSRLPEFVGKAQRGLGAVSNPFLKTGRGFSWPARYSSAGWVLFQGGINPSPTVFFHIFLKPCGEKIGLINYPAMPGRMLRRRKNLRKGFFFQNPGILYNRTIRKTFVIDKCP